MAELDRTFTEELFTEVLESTPCIIVYSQQAFECSKNYLNLKSATIIQYTIKGRFMSR